MSENNTIYIVSGLPRSGTSMLMQMLEAGGLRILTDRKRTADDDNPKGYYEDARVNSLDRDNTWLHEARGKLLKVVSPLLKYLPHGFRYRIVFVKRDIAEVLASQKKMLARRGVEEEDGDELMAQAFQKSLDEAAEWIDQSDNVDVLYVNHRSIINEPVPEVKKINEFLGGILNEEGMAGVVDNRLYRQRSAN